MALLVVFQVHVFGVALDHPELPGGEAAGEGLGVELDQVRFPALHHLAGLL